MAFAVTSILAQGIEYDEPLTKRFKQFAILGITGAATDNSWDFGEFGGTFWDAVDATDIGANALKVFRTIQTSVKQFWDVSGEALVPFTKYGTASLVPQVLTSAATAGGGTTESLTVTGLPAGAVLLALQRVSGGNAVGIVGNGAVSANAIANVVFSADPGAGALVRVAYLAGDTTPGAGSYTETMGTATHIPNLVFPASAAPTSALLCFAWDLQDDQLPVQYYQVA